MSSTAQTASEVFAVMRALNQELGVTIVIVTHDPAIANQIDRVVAIRDGRISTESFRRIEFRGRDAYVYHDEYAVVDRTGPPADPQGVPRAPRRQGARPPALSRATTSRSCPSRRRARSRSA